MSIMNNPPQQQPQSQSHPPHQSQSQPSQNQTQPHHAPSPPLRSLQTLSISPYPGDYRYNGVFGPPVPGQVPTQGWGSPTKRGSRSGIPTNWYDPPSRDSPIPHSATFEPYRRDASPPALSPPSSTTSGPTTSSSHPYPFQPAAAYPPVDPSAYGSMTVTPSPPPPIGYGSNMNGFNLPGLPQFGGQSLASFNPHNGAWTPRSAFVAGAGGVGTPAGNVLSLDDDVIPTAIVIKNIPFAVAREQLLGVIESLGAPLPYAFNYHHDNGIFRGLAFANFRAPEEAAGVVAALNGYDVQGRKLRVEYKKVLQPGEKDKIEREKALKRMRSIQFDNSAKDMPPPLAIPNHNPAIGANRGRGMNTSDRQSADIDHSPPHSASSGGSDNLPITLDLNDPVALDIYSRVLVFKEDRMRDDLAFSRSLTPMERRIVHLVAQKLGLTSITKGGEGEVRYVVVTRDSVGGRPCLVSSSSATVTSSATYLSPYSSAPNELSPSLRIKKSMPDLRGFNGPVVARDPARSLTPQRSSGNLRVGENRGSREYVSMGAVGGRRANGLGSGSNFNSFFGSPLDGVPPVPPLPAGLNMHGSRSSVSINGTNATGTSPDGSDHGAAPLRNPRGPASDNTRGFNGALRNSASGILRGPGSNSSTNAPGLGMGRRVSEEDEDGHEGSNHTVESLRTRESLEL